MNHPGPVLIHARGRQTPEECGLWNRLDAALRSRGSSLAVIAHHPASTAVTCRFERTYNGLDHAPGAGAPPERIGRWTIEELLERERFWRGEELDDRHTRNRREAIAYFAAHYQHILERERPIAAVIWSGHHPQELILAELCREREIPVAWLERGPLAGTLHLDTRGVLGGTTIADATDWSWSEDRQQDQWRTTFARYRDDLGHGTWWPQPASLGPEVLRERLGVSRGTRVACFAGQVDRDVQNLLYSPHFRSSLDAFEWFARKVRRLDPEGYILGKHHPRSDTQPESFERLLGDHAGCWLTDVSVQDCIGLCDRFAAVNSSSLFEALLRDRPVLMLGRGVLSGKGIAHEAAGPGGSATAVETWLAADRNEERAERFHDFGAFLLAEHLIAATERGEILGLRSAAVFARLLLERVAQQSTGVAA